MTDKLIELAKECEEAEAGRRDLDFQIRRALAGEPIEFETCWTAQQAVRWANGDSSDERKTPVYTASLDAALTLVPKGHDIKITQASGPGRSDWYGNCKLRNDWGGGICHKGNAASGALALCASALRARAAMNAEER
jgi:hypothetical protein